MNDFLMRQPRKKDAAEIHAMLQPYKPYVGTSPLYTYLLICEHFRKTSIVVENNDQEIVGFISAYNPPETPGTLFLWEIAVKEGYHGNNLYIRMVKSLYKRLKPQYIEATVNPSNTSSIKRLKKLAHMFKCEYTTQPLFPSKYFGEHSHEDEILYSIGLISTDT